MDMEPQRPLVLVRDRGEGFPGGVIENVVLEAVDDVLAGAIRQQHDPFGHFFDPLTFTHPKGGEHGLHLLALFLLRLLGVHVWHGQTELVHHEFTEHGRRQVAQELAQVFCIVHLHTPQKVWIGLVSASTAPSSCWGVQTDDVRCTERFRLSRSA